MNQLDLSNSPLLADTLKARRSFLTQSAGLIGSALAAESTGAHAQTQTPFFGNFKHGRIATTGCEIDFVMAGDGPPLLLLHGFPQTRTAWHKVAPRLAKKYTVVVADLRGYGDSGKPDGGEGHINYSKRSMALDQVELMRKLGFSRFSVVGHDRGGRVAHRMALDFPDAVQKVALLDIVPGSDVYAATDRLLATGYYHWFFLIQPAPMPEKMVAADLEGFLKLPMGKLMPTAIEPRAFAEYARCLSDPAAVHGMCEDYRAGATIDLEHDEADRNKKISCPTLVVWGSKGLVGLKFDVPKIWQRYAGSLTTRKFEVNHWIPEEAPEQLAAEIESFLGA